MAWTQEQHAIAKAKQLPLVSLAVNGKYAKMGGFSFDGPASIEEAKKIEDLLCLLLDARNRSHKKKIQPED